MLSHAHISLVEGTLYVSCVINRDLQEGALLQHQVSGKIWTLDFGSSSGRKKKKGGGWGKDGGGER